MLEIVALAAGALVSIGAATLGSWAILEVLLRLGEIGAKNQGPAAEALERLGHLVR